MASLAVENRINETLLLETLPAVRFIARRIHDRLPASVELDHLISAGTVGLMDALNKFDPSKGIQFKTYAQFRVKGAILDSLRELDWGSRALRRKAREVEDAHIRLRAKLGRAASEQEIADELSMALENYQLLLGDLKGLEIGSLHFADDEDGRTEDVSDKVADLGPTPFDCFESIQQKQLLGKWIDELPERERQVLSLYYYEELPMREIGALLGVVESRVSQLHTSAVARLRSRIRGEESAKKAKK